MKSNAGVYRPAAVTSLSLVLIYS